MPTLVYVFEYIARTLTNVTLTSAVLLPRSCLRFSHRLVSKVGLSGAEKINMSGVMVEAEVEDLKYPYIEYILLWFAESRAILSFLK